MCIRDRYGFDYVDGYYCANLKELRNDALNVHNLDWSVRKAVDFLEESQDEPFFLYFSTTLHHGPAPWAHKFSLEADPRMTGEGFVEEGFDVLPSREDVLKRNHAEAVGKVFTETAVHPERFDATAVRAYRAAAAEPGALRAMLNWYRAIPFGARDALGDVPTIETPTLMVWGEQDVALGKELTEGTDELVDDLTLRFLPDASHWVQQDQPDVVNAMLAAFLAGAPVPEHDTI